MSQENGNWVCPCVAVIIVIGIFILFFSIGFGIIFLLVAMILFGIFYSRRVNSQEAHERESRRHPELPSITPFEPETSPRPKMIPESIQVRFLDEEPPSAPRKKSMPKATRPAVEKISHVSGDTLQERINHLEERVRTLRQQLAEESIPPEITPTTRRKEEKLETPTEEVYSPSERSIRQLLEALDDKFEKGAISQQLYQRLRNKYLTRLKKAHKKQNESA